MTIQEAIESLKKYNYSVTKVDNWIFDYVVTLHTENGLNQSLYLSEEAVIKLAKEKAGNK